jgi:hypothetical protein
MFMVVSSFKTLDRTRQQTWLKEVPHVILLADPTLDTPWKYTPKTKTCIVRCKDDYDSLPYKVFIGFQFMEETFNPEYICKVDDDVQVHIEFMSTFIAKASLYDYCGNINSFSTSSLEISYCTGPLYYLSKRALGILCKSMDPSFISAYEDVCVGKTLQERGIYPTSQMVYTDSNDEFLEKKNYVAFHDSSRIYFKNKLFQRGSLQQKSPVEPVTLSKHTEKIKQERAVFNEKVKSLQKRYSLIL